MFQTIQKIIDRLDFSSINEDRKNQLHLLVDYIKEKLISDQLLVLNFICTHNSRRSQLAQIWAYTAAFYYKVPLVSYSGGVEVTEFNHRAVKTIQNMGFEVNKEEGINPHYYIKCAEDSKELEQFSKRFDDNINSKTPFAAIMTCGHADENCPFIPMADIRIPLRYEDPKIFDDTPEESKMYYERSLQIATELFYIFSKV